MSNLVKYKLKELQNKMSGPAITTLPTAADSDDLEMLRTSYQAVHTSETQSPASPSKSFLDEFNYSSLGWSDAKKKPSLYMVVGIAIFIFMVLVLSMASSHTASKPSPCPEPVLRETSQPMIIKTDAFLNLDALKCKSTCANACSTQSTDTGSFCCDWSETKGVKSCGMTFAADGACYCVGQAIDFNVLFQSLATTPTTASASK